MLTKFNLNVSTCYEHMERLLAILGIYDEQAIMAKYLCELATYYPNLHHYSPLTVTGAILLIASIVLKRSYYYTNIISELDWGKAEQCAHTFFR